MDIKDEKRTIENIKENLKNYTYIERELLTRKALNQIYNEEI